MTLTDYTQQALIRLDRQFQRYLLQPQPTAIRLQKAITYSVLNGGKRIRPLLTYLTCHTFDGNWDLADPAACAIELVHVYSLIHDDLPAMDNSDLRRGKPSCHKAFDEATAILAGDALQPLAFEILATHPAALSLQQRIKMIELLSKACGMQGMTAGQMLDMEGTHNRDINALTQMYQLKTGALLAASVQLGAVAAGRLDDAAQSALTEFATNLGLAFQIQDDLLDIESPTDTLGKPQNLDEINGKTTYPALVGVESSRKKITELFTCAMTALDFFGTKKSLLEEFAQQLMQRSK